MYEKWMRMLDWLRPGFIAKLLRTTVMVVTGPQGLYILYRPCKRNVTKSSPNLCSSRRSYMKPIFTAAFVVTKASQRCNIVNCNLTGTGTAHVEILCDIF